MLARGIRSYHRPAELAEALDLVRRGAVPVAGGTRVLAADDEVPNVLDLSALPLRGISVEDGDLRLGALTTLQEMLALEVGKPSQKPRVLARMKSAS